MRTTLTILLTLLASAWIGFHIVGRLLEDVELEYFQAVEESMVDTANLIASSLEGSDIHDATSTLRDLFTKTDNREFSAKIYSLVKTKIAISAYLTDENGIVLYDSEGLLEEQDFSQWNDVIKTLRGEYGARSSRTDPNDETTSVIHVAAPVYGADGAIIGVLTMRKAQESMGQFISESRDRITTTAKAVVIGVSGMGALLVFWIGLPVMRLTRYAEAVAKGKRVVPPRLGPGEVRRLGSAMEKMREELAGKNYVENYVKTLTHELKSPITAIQGAAELLEEDMPQERREKFLKNIRNEAARSEDIIRRVLNLAEIEARQTLETKEEIDLRKLVNVCTEGIVPHAEAKQIAITTDIPAQEFTVKGDPVLLATAANNLLQNAVDFSPEGSEVSIALDLKEDGVLLSVCDSGPGVPDYAKERVFERLFSLKDKVTGHKGSGLGLCFVREAAELHGGYATLENRSEGTGAVATFWVPVG